MSISAQLGKEAYLGIGFQAAYETAVARSMFLRVMKGDLKAEKVRNQSEELGRVTQKNHYKGLQKGVGSFSLKMHFDGMESLLKQLFGVTPNTTGTDPYTHVFDGVSDSPFPHGMTMELPLGTLTSMLATGCFITKFSFTFEANKAVILDIEVSAKDVSKQAAAISTPSFPDYNPVLSCEVVTLTLNSVSYPLHSIKINYELNLKTDQGIVGSVNPQEAYRDGMWDVTAEIPRLLENTTFIDALDAGTELPNLVIGVEGPGGSGVEELILEYPIALVEGDTPTADKQGALLETPKLRLLDGATVGSVSKLTVINATAGPIT